MSNNRSGLTIIELLISIAFLAVILVGVGGSLTSVFGAQNKNRAAANTAALARDTMEQIRGQWGVNTTSAQTAYSSNCIRLTLPANSTLKIFAVNTNGSTGNELSLFNPGVGGTCSAGSSTLDFKRVVLTISQPREHRLSLDFARPNPPTP